MISTTTENWIRWHAGLATRGRAGHGDAIADCLTRQGRSASELGAATEDLLSALGELNLELNGDPPSSSTEALATVPRSIVYAVAEISRMCRSVADELLGPAAIMSASRIEMAWLAVLAGDIDDLHAHLAEEGALRAQS